jgi:hypothetical protein
MKHIGMVALIMALGLTSVAYASPAINVLTPVEPRDTASGVTINRTGHPITLPLNTLSGTTFAGSDGELIFYGGHKGLYASVVTAEDWDNPPVQMNLIPEYIFKRNLSSIHDPEFRKELEGIIRITVEPAEDKVLSVMTVGETTAYIAFNPAKSVIMLSSSDKPNLFTQLILKEFGWEEIKNDILKGIKEN